MAMKLYKNIEFKPAYPTGHGAVVLAANPVQAAHLLEVELHAAGIDQHVKPKSMVEVSSKKAGVVQLITGEY